MTTAPSVDEFRRDVTGFLAASIDSGVACPAFGAILPPDLTAAAVAWQRHCLDHGYAGIHWPVAHGGRGLGRTHTAVWYEECARAGVAPYVNLQGVVLAGEAILRSGTADQQRRFLRSTIAADTIWCQLFSEPGAGSDLAALQTRAEPDGDGFVVNGQKVWSSNAEQASHGILLARTDPSLPRHRGISFFLLDMSLPGVDVRPLRQMTGHSEFCEVFLTDVAVPADALLGARNDGWAVAMAVLGDERGSSGAAGVIALERRLDQLARRAPAGDAVARGRLARLLAAGTALGWLMQRGGDDPAAAPAAKLARSEIEFDARLVEADVRGADAMLWDPTTEAFLYSPGMRIAGGTSEVQRNIIGERQLGLPR